MKKNLAMVAVLLLTGLVSNAAQITKVIVRQQWPWSEKIKIEYPLESEARVSEEKGILIVTYSFATTPSSEYVAVYMF